MPSDDIEAVVTRAREQVEAASKELQVLREQLDDCETELSYVHGAVDQLLASVDELVVFVGEKVRVEGVSEAVATRLETDQDDLVGQPFAQVAELLGLGAVVDAVREALGGADPAREMRVGAWDVSVKAVDEDRSGVVVIAQPASAA